MKNISILFFISFLLFSCAKDELTNPSAAEFEAEQQLSSRSNECSLTFLGYDENGCCKYLFNWPTWIPPISDRSPCSAFITVNGKRIKGSIFSVCGEATVKLVRGCTRDESVVCSTTVNCCEDCHLNSLSYTASQTDPQNGMDCCFIVLKKEGPLSICDSNGGSAGIKPQPGITIEYLAGSPATVGMIVCHENWVNTVTGFWQVKASYGVNICPEFQIPIDLNDCN